MAPKRQRKRKEKFNIQGGATIKTPMGLAISANAKANYALSQLNAEVKYKQFAFNPTSTLAGSIFLLNALNQGTGSHNERIGQSVRFKSIDLRILVDNHLTADLPVRYLLVRDRSPNGVMASIGDILDTSLVNPVRTFRNLDYTKRFTVLWDSVHVFTSKSNSSSNLRFIQHYVDLEDRAKSNSKGKQVNETNYGLGTAGSIADISENAYYFIAIGDDPTDGVTTNINVRLRYVDN